MKRYLKKIGILLVMLTIIFSVISIKPTKAATTTLTASSSSVKSGGNFSINITSSIKLASWSISVTNDGGCSFSGVTGTANAQVNGSSITDMSASGTSSLATYKFKAPTVTKDTTFKITFSATQLSDSDTNPLSNASCVATVNVKAESTGSSGNSGTTTTKPKEPTFKSANKTVYTTGDVNLRSSWSTSSSATTVKEGTELTLTGTSTETVNGYVWYRVTYKGTTKYVAKSLITETKPKEDNKDDNKDDEKPQETDKKSSNKSLSSLSIEGIELTPKFNKETTKYTAKVDGDVTELKINYKAEDSKAKVTVEGNKDLKEGDNVIKVKVTAEDDTTRTYFITVTKGEGTEADTSLKLSELKIERVNFEDTFKPDTYTYELSLNTYVKKLHITATPNQADAKVEITGNNEFKAGKNMVIVLLTSADGKQTATYQIEVNLPEEVIVESQKNDMEKNIVTGIAIFIAIIIVVIIVANLMKKRSKLEDEDEEKFDNTVEDKKENDISESKKTENDSTLDNSDNEIKEKDKRTKGKHSM